MKKSNEIKKMIDKEGIEVPELGIKIIPRQMFNGKVYDKNIEEFLPTYEILQKLRNIAFESNWEKYSFMKKFWVFVPNPDKVSKEKGFVAWFDAYDDWAFLFCGRIPSYRDSNLGVFLYCPIEK